MSGSGLSSLLLVAIGLLIAFVILVFVAWRVGRRERSQDLEQEARFTESLRRAEGWSCEIHPVRAAWAVLEFLRSHEGRNIRYEPHWKATAVLEYGPLEQWIRAEMRWEGARTRISVLLSPAPACVYKRKRQELVVEVQAAHDRTLDALRTWLDQARQRQEEQAHRRHPAADLDPAERAMLPTLGAFGYLDLYVAGESRGLIRVTPEHPLVGVIFVDVTGEWWVTPEEDYRAGCMGAIHLHVFGPTARPWTGKTVWLSGYFADGAGFLVEEIGPHSPEDET